MCEWSNYHKDRTPLTKQERLKLEYYMGEAIINMEFEPPIKPTPWEQYLLDKELDNEA